MSLGKPAGWQRPDGTIARRPPRPGAASRHVRLTDIAKSTRKAATGKERRCCDVIPTPPPMSRLPCGPVLIAAACDRALGSDRNARPSAVLHSFGGRTDSRRVQQGRRRRDQTMEAALSGKSITSAQPSEEGRELCSPRSRQSRGECRNRPCDVESASRRTKQLPVSEHELEQEIAKLTRKELAIER